MDAITALIERAVGGPELPDYDGLPDSGPLLGAATTAPTRP
jgi:hypothetical protein